MWMLCSTGVSCRIHCCHLLSSVPRITFDIKHYDDVTMTTMASQITSLTVVYSIVYLGVDQRKHQSSASLAFVRGIHRDRWIPAQRASNAENVSIWWRHHEDSAVPHRTCIVPAYLQQEEITKMGPKKFSDHNHIDHSWDWFGVCRQ